LILIYLSDGFYANLLKLFLLCVHRHYYSLKPKQLQELSGQTHPVIVDGRNVVYSDVFIDAGFVYKGIGRGDKNGHDVVN
jgi:UDP-N-acetyl-D-mannosaminuronic acid dehydrogenase